MAIDPRIIDHTLLRADATQTQIDQLVTEARLHGFATVCVNPTWVRRCAAQLADTGIDICTVAGFPLGASTSTAKAAEALDAVEGGAHEIDMVMNIGLAKQGAFRAVAADIAAVRQAVPHPTVLKVILESCLLTDDEIVSACEAARDAGADFVKTSTGFSTAGATVAAVRLMSATVAPGLGVKASGGIRTRADAEALVAAGATRIGASAGIRIIGEE